MYYSCIVFSWCRPCHELGPRLETAVERAGLDLCKVDIDDYGELAVEYDVTAVPTVLGVMNGKVIDRFIGTQDNNEIKRFIEALVKYTD